MVTSRAVSVLVAASALTATAIAVHTALNLRYLRRPNVEAPEVDEPVTVLIPARNEAAHVQTTVRSVLAQSGIRHLSVVVLDDDSGDETPALVRELVDQDPRLSLITGTEPPPPQWLGKPWACARLAESSSGSVLVFVDADVVLGPGAVRAVVDTLRTRGFAMVAPYPRQVAGTWLERLVQPLVTWSWVATVPLHWAETSTRPSLSAANGQLLAVDAVAYRSVGGHGAVRDQVIEDVALMRAFKVAGLHTATVDGSHLATCRMYEGTEAVVAGYGKSLWSAFNGAAGSIAVCTLLAAVYVVPPLAMVSTRDPRIRAMAALGYAAGVASRAIVARRTGERIAPDALGQPASVVAFIALNAISWRRHLAGANTWKGRPVTVAVAGKGSP